MNFFRNFTNEKTRRIIIKLLFFLIPASLIVRFLSPKIHNTSNFTVPIASIPQNGVYMIKNRKIAIIQKDGKISAVSLKCTHLGCTLNVNGDYLVCPCHGSKFTLEGEVLKGPALRNLDIIKVKIEGENVLVFAE